MTGFTSLADALHAGYDVIASTQSGYIVRLVRGDGAESYGLVTLAANPEPARDAPRASAVSGCSAKFALERRGPARDTLSVSFAPAQWFHPLIPTFS